MQKKAKNTKKKPGRSKIELDRPLINGFIDDQLSIRAIADIVGVDPMTIKRRFATKLKKRKAEQIVERVDLRQKLRKAQWDSAIDDKNPVMMIWLGKNELGQADKIETTEKQVKKTMKITFGK